MPDNATDDDAKRLAALSAMLGELSAAMADQAEFHRGEAVLSGVRGISEGAEFAARRAAKAVVAGPGQMREIEKTVLAELTRAALLAAAALAEAGAEGWPCLGEKAAEARAALRDAAGRDASLLAPAGMDADQIMKSSVPAPFEDPPGWVDAGRGRFAFLAEDGVLLSAVALPGLPEGPAWIGRMGSVGVAITAEPGSAASAACSAHAALLGRGAAQASGGA